MTRLASVALLLAMAAACGKQPHWPDVPPADRCAAGAFPEGPIVVDVVRPERTRRALVWVPRGEGPFDVVVNLHEFRSDPQRQQYYSTWQPYAEEARVMLVAPDGKSSTWNAGACCGKAQEQGIDDVGFLDALVARLDEVGCTSGRVLATGIGNGAMMAQRWACESDVPDAVVSVGGSLQQEACPSARPIPLLHYHGDADTFVPPDGAKGVLVGGLPGGRHHPVELALRTFTERNGARQPERTVRGDLACTTWPGDQPTAFCSVTGGADTWPGSANGKVDSDSPLADATRGAWAWVLDAWSPPPTPPDAESAPLDEGAPLDAEEPGAAQPSPAVPATP